MEAIWSLVAQIGLWLLNTFISDLVKRDAMKKSFQQFVANRQIRANATIEIKDNLDEQNSDLDQVKKGLEKPTEKKP